MSSHGRYERADNIQINDNEIQQETYFVLQIRHIVKMHVNNKCNAKRGTDVRYQVFYFPFLNYITCKQCKVHSLQLVFPFMSDIVIEDIVVSTCC